MATFQKNHLGHVILFLVILTGVFLANHPERHRIVSPPPSSPVEGGGVYQNTYHEIGPFMQGIYVADHTVTSTWPSPIHGLVIPHHLVATASIATGIKSLAGQSFTKILLLSPDHFHHCPTVFCTVDGRYETLFGTVAADKDTIHTLSQSPLVTKNATLFETEHGIFADLPYIAHYFPGIPVTPLVLSQRVPWKNRSQELLAVIDQAVDTTTLFIVSSDFSHYLPLAQAEQMDAKTERALTSNDLPALMSLRNPDQSDCPGCLWLMGALAEKRHFAHPTVILHTNSETILQQPGITETTSHFSILWSDEPPQKPGK